MTEKTLEEKVQLLLDYEEIKQLMNKYEWYLDAGRWDELVDLFALKTPGVRVDMVWGVYEGAESVKKLYLKLHSGGRKVGLPQGIMWHLLNTTHVIEVAGDGKTAQGIWICTGDETIPRGPAGGSLEGFGSGSPEGYWGVCKRGADFIKEDGKWKIWHYVVYGSIHTPFGKDWAEPKPADAIDELDISHKLPDEVKPDRPTTHTLWDYSPTATVEYMPPVPQPYETWDEVNTHVT